MKNEELGWCGARGSAGLAAFVGMEIIGAAGGRCFAQYSRR